MKFFILVLLVPAALAFPTGGDNSRIVGGSVAAEGAYPYQVSLRRNGDHFCGGSIISNRIILTAAHCVPARTVASRIWAHVGTNKLDEGGIAYQVSSMRVHEKYDSQDHFNDIALLTVNRDIEFTPRIKPIPLANILPMPGSFAILSGWGITSYPSNQVPNQLQHISFATISASECKSRLQGFPLGNGHVCTSPPTGQGACQGDSGGPLVAKGTQIGIVSWGIPCGKGKPDVYTSVAYYRDWINEHSGV